MAKDENLMFEIDFHAVAKVTSLRRMSQSSAPLLCCPLELENKRCPKPPLRGGGVLWEQNARDDRRQKVGKIP